MKTINLGDPENSLPNSHDKPCDNYGWLYVQKTVGFSTFVAPSTQFIVSSRDLS